MLNNSSLPHKLDPVLMCCEICHISNMDIMESSTTLTCVKCNKDPRECNRCKMYAYFETTVNQRIKDYNEGLQNRSVD